MVRVFKSHVFYAIRVYIMFVLQMCVPIIDNEKFCQYKVTT